MTTVKEASPSLPKKKSNPSKSRKSRNYNKPAPIDTLLGIVDDNKLMHKRYLGDRVPMINVSVRGIHLSEDTDKGLKFETGHTFSNVPRFSHQSYNI